MSRISREKIQSEVSSLWKLNINNISVNCPFKVKETGLMVNNVKETPLDVKDRVFFAKSTSSQFLQEQTIDGIFPKFIKLSSQYTLDAPKILKNPYAISVDAGMKCDKNLSEFDTNDCNDTFGEVIIKKKQRSKTTSPSPKINLKSNRISAENLFSNQTSIIPQKHQIHNNFKIDDDMTNNNKEHNYQHMVESCNSMDSNVRQGDHLKQSNVFQFPNNDKNRNINAKFKLNELCDNENIFKKKEVISKINQNFDNFNTLSENLKLNLKKRNSDDFNNILKKNEASNTFISKCSLKRSPLKIRKALPDSVELEQSFEDKKDLINKCCQTGIIN